LAQSAVFFDFGKHYLAAHKTIPQDFIATDDVLHEFKDFLAEEKIQVSDQDFKDNQEFIKTRIRGQLVAVIYGEGEANRISIQNDLLVQGATQHMTQAAELLANAKKYMASRNQARTALAHP